jgi:hypothetical protein
MIVEMEVMNSAAKASNAKMEHSNVNQDIVLLHTSVAMVIEIVETCLMKLAAHRNIQEVAIVLKQDSSATTISVFSILTFVMVLTIAEVTF